MYYRHYNNGCCLGGCLTLPVLLLASPFIWLFRPRHYGWGWGRPWHHHHHHFHF